jgi:hypothetical protein
VDQRRPDTLALSVVGDAGHTAQPELAHGRVTFRPTSAASATRQPAGFDVADTSTNSAMPGHVRCSGSAPSERDEARRLLGSTLPSDALT